MKNLTFIIGLFLFTGCFVGKSNIPSDYIIAIDSVSHFAEYVNNPGTFAKGYDTIHLEIKHKEDRKGFVKNKYKIISESETVYKRIE